MSYLVDLTGQKYGRLTVLKQVPKPPGGRRLAHWLCQCECGKQVVVDSQKLRQGNTKSCGCLKEERKTLSHLEGQVFGELTVIEKVPKPEHLKTQGTYYKCQCNCGNVRIVYARSLTTNRTKSCGCIKQIKAEQEMIKKRFGKLTVIKSTNLRSNDGHIVYLCQCDCGNTCYINSNSLMAGNSKSCGCLSSIGEAKIQKILDEYKISYKKQVTFQDLISKKGGLLRFDFGIYFKNKLQFLIEFQGEQHYEDTNSFFDNPKENDKLKNDYCLKNNIPLILIPYWKREKISIELIIPEDFNFLYQDTERAEEEFKV